MRLGEIKNILDEVLDESNKIHIENEVAYGGQAQKITNFGQIISALDILSAQSWNDTSYAEIENIKKQYKKTPSIATLETAQFNQLNSYINAINQKLPLFYSILESLVEEQDEKVINIKLPEGIESLEELDTTNKRLEDILKLFNVDGQFQFQGFDKGSLWYVLMAAGPLSYGFLIGCLNVAQEYLKAKTEYFKSEEAKISFQAALQGKEDKFTFEKYQEGWLSIFIKDKVKKVIEEIGQTNGASNEELHTKLVKATTNLVAELGEGTEFHLSLNPPEYASEEKGAILKIDYQKIKALVPKKEKETKQLKEAEAKDGKKKENPEQPQATQ